MTTKELYTFLSDQMKRLEERVITIEDLKAQASATKQLNNLLKYELDRARTMQKYPEISIREIES